MFQELYPTPLLLFDFKEEFPFRAAQVGEAWGSWGSVITGHIEAELLGQGAGGSISMLGQLLSLSRVSLGVSGHPRQWAQ